jgi:hypothetical protein
MMLLRLGGAGLTATQPEVILTNPNACLDLGTPAVQTTHLWGRQRQGMAP